MAEVAAQNRASTAGASVDLASTLTQGMRAVITLTVMAATLMEVLDTSIVNVALPDMQGSLGASLDQIGWVSTGYIIANVIILPLTGWLSDFFGRKRYLTYSIILFTLASFGCGSSRSLGALILFRVLQGTGGAAFLATAQATLMEIYPKRLQGFAQAMFGIGVVMAPTLGPSLGGFITDRFTWPWIFFVNVPIGILATILTLLYMPDSGHAGSRRGADFIGIGFLAIGLGSLQTILERGERDDWFQADYIRVLALLSAAGLAAFIYWELHPNNKNPAVDLRIARNANLVAGSLAAFSLGFVLYGSVFALPQFLQTLQAHTAEQTGILLIPGGLATAFMMPIVGRYVSRVDARILVGAGICLVSASVFVFADRFTTTAPESAFFWPLILRGMGIGLQFVPLSIVALGTLPQRELASGAGLYNLFRQLGGSFGIAILATILDRKQKLHFSALAAHVSMGSLAAETRLAQMQGALQARGLDAHAAQLGAMKLLVGTVTRQAYLGAFIDLFRLTGYIGLTSLLLLLLFKKAQAKPGAGAVH